MVHPGAPETNLRSTPVGTAMFPGTCRSHRTAHTLVPPVYGGFGGRAGNVGLAFGLDTPA